MKQNWTVSLLLLAACAGWTMAVPFGKVSSPYLGSVGAATVLVAAGFRMVDAGRLRWLAAGETLAVIAVPVGIFAVGWIGGSLDEPSLLAGLPFALTVWLVSAITITDIEAVTEPTDLVEGVSGALGRITTRLLLVGMLLMSALVAGHGGLAPVTRARPIQAGLVIPFLLYWMVGLGGLASLNRSRLLARWKRDRSQIDADLGERGRTAAALWVAVGAVGSVLWWWIGRPPLGLGHTVATTGARGLAGFIGRLFGADLPTANPSGPSGPSQTTVVPPPPTNSGNPVTPPPEWFDLFLLLIAGAIFAFAFVVFRRRVQARGGSDSSMFSRALRAIWDALGVFLKELGKLLKSFFKPRANRAAARDHRSRSGTTVPPGWSPADPIRRRIAGEYRAFLTATRERIGPIPGTETPSELARRIEAAETSEAALGVLTGIYELARFSLQPLDESVVRQAQEARATIVGRWEEPG
ncbi:MAG TPA: DUF4129 domain-containing protein [Acidimicrobiia bacterium]|nr:DUF4129 domain-containing protein [Acidimicrobiia bacterium]